MLRARALACPASLKGVLSAREAAAALAEGLGQWASADEQAVADGGEGTLDVLESAVGGSWRLAEVHDAFGRPRRARWLELPDGTAAVEAAEAIPLDSEHLDAVLGSSRGLGELIRSVGEPPALVVFLGGTATVDGGNGLREVLDDLPAPTRVACDVAAPLVDAARVYARQKGASADDAQLLEARLTADPELRRFADVPGAGAAGGLGARLASLGATLVPGAEFVLNAIGFDPRPYDLVVTGEGTVDATTTAGKAPGEIARRCAAAGVHCILFGGIVAEPPRGIETVALSGRPERARPDLVELGERLRALR